MRAPFDFMPSEAMQDAFASAGFSDLRLERQTRPLRIPGGIGAAVQVAYASPIGPHLITLSADRRAAFHERLAARLTRLSSDGLTMGQMVSRVLLGRRPA